MKIYFEKAKFKSGVSPRVFTIIIFMGYNTWSLLAPHHWALVPKRYELGTTAASTTTNVHCVYISMALFTNKRLFNYTWASTNKLVRIVFNSLRPLSLHSGLLVLSRFAAIETAVQFLIWSWIVLMAA